MNISGIRTCAGFYDYNTISINAARGQQIQEAKGIAPVSEHVPEEVTQNVTENAAETANTITAKEPDRGAEEFAKKYQPDAVYELKGAESNLFDLDIEKAISDMKKDHVLQQYQFFIGENSTVKTEGLNTIRKNENFIL